MSAVAENVIPFTSEPACTDVGNAERFVAHYGGVVRFVRETGWFIYDGRKWALDQQNRAVTFAIDVAKSITNEEWRIKSQARSRLNAMLQVAESLLPASMSDFDLDPWLLNCSNGIVDLRTGQLQAHSSAHFITRVTPVAYDPSATCDTWVKFVNRVMNDDPDLVDYVQRAVGYSLTALINEQCLFFCLGRGRNGKSVLIETILAMVGEYGLNSTTQAVMKRSGGIPNDIARLAGCRFVSLNETGEGQAFNEPLLKDLTGGDTVSARFLFKEYFDFAPKFKFWIRGNHQPVIKGTDDGIWRRFRVIPFAVQIPESECDPSLPQKLKGELAGILRWAVGGCMKWQIDGLKTPQSVKDAVSQYRKDSDPVGEFLEDSCVFDANAVVQATSLYQAYRAWATTSGEQRLSQTQFGRSLRSRGYKKGKASTKYYQGIALKGQAG